MRHKLQDLEQEIESVVEEIEFTDDENTRDYLRTTYHELQRKYKSITRHYYKIDNYRNI